MEEVITVTTKPCLVCQKTSELEFTLKEWVNFTDNNNSIQDIFPHWTPGKRELLITGIHEHCWDILEDADYNDLDVEDGLDELD